MAEATICTSRHAKDLANYCLLKDKSFFFFFFKATRSQTDQTSRNDASVALMFVNFEQRYKKIYLSSNAFL